MPCFSLRSTPQAGVHTLLMMEQHKVYVGFATLSKSTRFGTFWSADALLVFLFRRSAPRALVHISQGRQDAQASRLCQSLRVLVLKKKRESFVRNI